MSCVYLCQSLLVCLSVWSSNFTEKSDYDKVHGDKVYGDKVHGDKVHGDKVHDDKVHGDKVHGDKVHGDKVHGDKVYGDKVHGVYNLCNRNLSQTISYDLLIFRYLFCNVSV